MSKSYDYIIVGAGAAGCVMAYRLSANRDCQVLLLEAGPADKSLYIHMPKAIGKALSQPDLVWPYQTEAQDDNNDTPEFWARGKTLGGSSAVNGMMYVRGQPGDFNTVAKETSNDWNWANIGEAYRQLESHALGEDKTRGGNGPLHISMPSMKNDLTEALIEAGVALGLARKEDVNAPDDAPCVGYAPRTVRKGRRETAATAFLNPIRSRPNLTVKTGVTVDRLMVEGRRAVGVHVIEGGKPNTYHCSSEVILAAGALASPAMLQRSGIGPADELRAAGIDVLEDSPNVGRNLREHRAMVMQWRVRDELSFNAAHKGAQLLGNIARYYLKHDGVLAAATYELGAWFKTEAGLDRPDGQFLIAPYSFDYSQPVMDTESFGGMQFCVYQLRPDSQGSLTVRSSDPTVLPKIAANYYGEPADRKRMIDVVRFAREYVRHPLLKDMVFEETRPTLDYQSDDEIIAAYNKFGNGAYHASGTCRMGADNSSVVDPQLRVRGLEGVRVVDTSITPFIVAGNTQGPAMAMAWRAADLIINQA